MEKPNYLDIDGRQLRLLFTIYDAGSLTAAANRMDVNQSTVSYQLDKLRQHFNDPLFIRSGQGVIATEKTEQLIPQAREILHSLEVFSESEVYDPSQDSSVLRIAANSLERDLVVRPLLSAARERAPKLGFDLCATGSGHQVVEGLREGTYDFAIFPTILSAAEGIMQRALLPMKFQIFYDSQTGSPPTSMQEYCERQHARVALSHSNSRFEIDDELAEFGVTRRVILQVRDFDSLGVLLKGTDIITTQPDLFSFSCLRDLSSVPLPFEMPERKVAIFWHERYHNSVRHQYWRNLITDIVKPHPD